MARQKGIIKLSGTIGDINFYVAKGKGYARKAGGGFNSKSIKTKDSMQRVRENGSEFGHCSMVKRKLLEAFKPYVLKRERGFHGKCMGLLLKLKGLDSVSKRGARNVLGGLQTLEGQRQFRNFPFGKPMKFLDAIAYQWHFEAISQRLTLPSFIRSDYDELMGVNDIKIGLFMIDFDFEALEFQKQLLDHKTISIQEKNPSQTLSPASAMPISHTAIFYVGLELVSEIAGKGSVLGMRVV